MTTMRERFRLPDLERRSFPGRLRLERRAGRGASVLLVGHAAVFNSQSEDLGGFVETVRPGAFARALREHQNVAALFNHEPSWILGRTASETLRLREDRVGLAVEIEPPETAIADHVVTAIERGDVSQMSFSFRTIQDRWTAGAPVLRELLDVDLFDVSPVVFPAYPATDVSLEDEDEDPEAQARERLLQLHELTLGDVDSPAFVEALARGRHLSLLVKQ
jgi:HK97 family phage prohead protease